MDRSSSRACIRAAQCRNERAAAGESKIGVRSPPGRLPCAVPAVVMEDGRRLTRGIPLIPLNPGESRSNFSLLIHESPLTDTLFLLVSKSDEVTTT